MGAFCNIFDLCFVYCFYLVDEGREDPNTTKRRPSSARQRNAIKWRFSGRGDNGPTLNAGLATLWFSRGSGPVFFCGSFMFCSVLCLLCLCARLFICALWSPAGIGLTSWLSFVVSNCEFVTFPLVSWVRYLIVTIPDLCTLTYFAKDHYSLMIFIGGLDPLPPPHQSPQMCFIKFAY